MPTAIDRFIQQALLQVLQTDWHQTFSEPSSGFRPKRSAHQTIVQAQCYVREGYGWTVDMDLAKFFDNVNHGPLCAHFMKAGATRTNNRPDIRLQPISLSCINRYSLLLQGESIYTLLCL